MARKLDDILNLVRKSTGNRNTDGIYDDEFVEFFNDALKLIQGKLVDVNSSLFYETSYISIVSGQLQYDLPTDLFMSTMIKSVRQTGVNSGTEETYYPLELVDRAEQSYIYGYKISGGKLTLTTTPTSSVVNGLKLDYVKTLKRIEIRRGKITSLSPLTIDTATVPDKTLWDADYLTIVDKDGVQKVVNIEFTSYLAGVITTPTSLTGAAIGNYIIYGANSTTHHELPDLFDTYLREFCKLMIMHRDSSRDVDVESPILMKIEENLVSIYSNDNHTAKYIPITDPDMLVY